MTIITKDLYVSTTHTYLNNMSVDDKEKDVKVKEEITREDIVVRVDRGPAEKTLEDEKTALAIERDKMQDQLAKATDELENLKKQTEDKGTEFDTLTKERDELKSQLQEIAMAEFNRVKTEKMEMLKRAEVPQEQIDEYDEKVQTPADLDASEWMLSFIGTQIAKAEVEKKAKKEAGEGGGGNDDEGSSDPSNPPGGSVATLPPTPSKKWQYTDARAAIDDMYKKRAAGGAEGEEADKMLNQLWEKAVQTMKKNPQFAITECPICGGGILKDEKCPYCNFDPFKYKAGGGDIW